MEIIMSTHKAYARINEKGLVTKFFSDIFEQPTAQDILIGEGYDEEFVRPQNKYQLTDSEHRYNYKIVEEKLVERTVEEKKADTGYIEEVRSRKLKEVAGTCEQTIYAGTDVTTSKGLEHFSLKPEDQTNMSAIALAIGGGAKEVPYHANGQLCRIFTAEEFISMFTAVKNFVAYNTTLCNHLNVWIRRCKTVDEINEITYSSVLPNDLQANMNAILGIKS